MTRIQAVKVSYQICLEIVGVVDFIGCHGRYQNHFSSLFFEVGEIDRAGDNQGQKKEDDDKKYD